MGQDSISPPRLRHLLATLFPALFLVVSSSRFAFSATGLAAAFLTAIFIIHSASVFVLALVFCFPGFFAFFGLCLQDLCFYLLPIYGPAGQGAIASTIYSAYTYTTTTAGCFVTSLVILAITSLYVIHCNDIERAAERKAAEDRIARVIEGNRMSARMQQYKHQLDVQRAAKERVRFMEERTVTIQQHEEVLLHAHRLLRRYQDTLAVKDYEQQAVVFKKALVSHQMQMRLGDLTEERDRLLERASALAHTLKAVDIVRRSNQEGFERQKTALQTQYSTLEGSLAFANAEHRIHMEYCDHNRADTRQRIKDLDSLLDAERTGREELQAEYDVLRHRHAAVSDDHVIANKSLKSLELELEGKEARYRAALDDFHAGQQALDTLVDRLKDETSEMRTRLCLVSEGYSMAEKRLQESERERYKLFGQHRLALATYHAGERISNDFIEELMQQAPRHPELSMSNRIPGTPTRRM